MKRKQLLIYRNNPIHPQTPSQKNKPHQGTDLAVHPVQTGGGKTANGAELV